MKKLEPMKKLEKVSDEEFEELLKKFGSKTMITFDINETIKFSKKQLKKLEDLFKTKEKGKN